MLGLTTGTGQSRANWANDADIAVGATKQSSYVWDRQQTAQDAQPVSAGYLSPAEREQFADMLAQKKSICAIARDLGRKLGSISRET